MHTTNALEGLHNTLKHCVFQSRFVRTLKDLVHNYITILLPRQAQLRQSRAAQVGRLRSRLPYKFCPLSKFSRRGSEFVFTSSYNGATFFVSLSNLSCTCAARRMCRHVRSLQLLSSVGALNDNDIDMDDDKGVELLERLQGLRLPTNLHDVVDLGDATSSQDDGSEPAAVVADDSDDSGSSDDRDASERRGRELQMRELLDGIAARAKIACAKLNAVHDLALPLKAYDLHKVERVFHRIASLTETVDHCQRELIAAASRVPSSAPSVTAPPRLRRPPLQRNSKRVRVVDGRLLGSAEASIGVDAADVPAPAAVRGRARVVRPGSRSISLLSLSGVHETTAAERERDRTHQMTMLLSQSQAPAVADLSSEFTESLLASHVSDEPPPHSWPPPLAD